LAALISLAYGQESKTGAIRGIVNDATTKTPLPGVNIILEGTSWGAATDANGDYYILNISPGNYVVTVSMIGYTTTRIENVAVQVDRTSVLNFEMEELMDNSWKSRAYKFYKELREEIKQWAEHQEKKLQK